MQQKIQTSGSHLAAARIAIAEVAFGLAFFHGRRPNSCVLQLTEQLNVVNQRQPVTGWPINHAQIVVEITAVVVTIAEGKVLPRGEDVRVPHLVDNLRRGGAKDDRIILPDIEHNEPKVLGYEGFGIVRLVLLLVLNENDPPLLVCQGWNVELLLLVLRV